MPTIQDVTALVVNYQTRDLTERCVESFLAAYPTVRLLLIDNGSQDDSISYLQDVLRRHQQVRVLFNRDNRNHGPALHQGMLLSNTRYVFTLDSDSVVLRSGFLEAMLEFFHDPATYAVGDMRYMDIFGFDLPAGSACYTHYIHPSAMLLDRAKYVTLKRFFHHGSPCLRNMHDAERKGFYLYGFPIQEYCLHLGRGTCSRYGYRLSVKTLIESYISRWLARRL